MQFQKYFAIRRLTAYALVLAFFFCMIGATTETFAEDIAVEKSRTLSLEEVLLDTYHNNLSLRAARAKLKAVEELMPQAWSNWKPSVSSSLGISATDIDGSNFNGGDGSTAKDISIDLSQPLYRGGRSLAQRNKAYHAIEEQKALLNSEEQSILKQAAEAYLDLWQNQNLLDIANRTGEIIARELEGTKMRFEVGELTKTDVAQAESRYARTQANVITAKGALLTAEAKFKEITGIENIPKVDAPSFSLKIPETLEEALNQTDEHSPDLIAAVHKHKQSEEQIRQTKGELLPEINLSSQWNKTLDPSPGVIDKQTNTSIGILATIPLYQSGAVYSRIRETKHLENQQYLESMNMLKQEHRDVTDKWTLLQTAQAEIEARKAQVEAARIAQEGMHYERELGSRSILDILDTDQDVFDAEEAFIRAQRNKYVAEFMILEAIGILKSAILEKSRETINLEENP